MSHCRWPRWPIGIQLRVVRVALSFVDTFGDFSLCLSGEDAVIDPAQVCPLYHSGPRCDVRALIQFSGAHEKNNLVLLATDPSQCPPAGTQSSSTETCRGSGDQERESVDG
jgi:hypothetical protein